MKEMDNLKNIFSQVIENPLSGVDFQEVLSEISSTYPWFVIPKMIRISLSNNLVRKSEIIKSVELNFYANNYYHLQSLSTDSEYAKKFIFIEKVKDADNSNDNTPSEGDIDNGTVIYNSDWCSDNTDATAADTTVETVDVDATAETTVDDATAETIDVDATAAETTVLDIKIGVTVDAKVDTVNAKADTNDLGTINTTEVNTKRDPNEIYPNGRIVVTPSGLFYSEETEGSKIIKEIIAVNQNFDSDGEISYDDMTAEVIKLFLDKKIERIIPKESDITKEIINLSINDVEEIITESMAKVYHMQGLNSEAISIYNKLSLKYPEKIRYFANIISSIKLEDG